MLDVVLAMGEPDDGEEEMPRSLSMERLPSSEAVGDEARWKWDAVGELPGDVCPSSRGWRISFQDAANCLARCEDKTQEGDMVG